jgi:hypothetical protein
VLFAEVARLSQQQQNTVEILQRILEELEATKRKLQKLQARNDYLERLIQKIPGSLSLSVSLRLCAFLIHSRRGLRIRCISKFFICSND